MYLYNFILYFCSVSVGDPLYGGYVNDQVRFRVYNTGTVRWILPLPVTTTCDVDISKFPFDSQSCYIELYFMRLNGVDVDPNITQEVDIFKMYDFCRPASPRTAFTPTYTRPILSSYKKLSHTSLFLSSPNL